MPLVLLCSFRVFSSSGDIKNGVMVTKFFLRSKKFDNRVYISYGFYHLLLCSTLMVMASLSSFWVWCRQVIVRLMTKVSRWSTIIFPTIFTSTGVWNEKKILVLYLIQVSIFPHTRKLQKNWKIPCNLRWFKTNIKIAARWRTISIDYIWFF